MSECSESLTMSRRDGIESDSPLRQARGSCIHQEQRFGQAPRATESATGRQIQQSTAAPILDFLGIGFGPSNLALAVAAEEIAPGQKGLFLERNPTFRWHPGMLMDTAVMQVSFLKDLATLRNPASPYTFLQYVKAKGRLERFINLRDFYPTRLEYQDYLAWVGAAFADKVRYGTTVTAVSPVSSGGDGVPCCFRVTADDAATGEAVIHLARNVVYAAGGRPRVPAGVACDGARVFHSSNFLPGFPERFADCGQAYEFVVAGDGQSAGEIVAHLLDNYPRARIQLLIAGCAPRATDNSHFVNEQFSAGSLDAFHRSDARSRAALMSELRSTNYGVIEADLIERLYRGSYLDEVKGRRRLFIHPFSRLVGVDRGERELTVRVRDVTSGSERGLSCSAVVLATGYARELDPDIFADVLPYLARDAAGGLVLSRRHRVAASEMRCGLYLQGFGQASFGPSDTLLSLLPIRATGILEDIIENSEPASPEASPSIEYPPVRHLEHSRGKLLAVMERFPFATLVSAARTDDPLVTHLPLILDRTRGKSGILFGHLDRANPQAAALDGRRVTAIFHGPNSYISPHVYRTDQLPTWNSMNVHVTGTVRTISERGPIVAGLCRIAECCEQGADAFSLAPDDRRIDKLIGHIVAFELEIDQIVGRFKLSQDRNECDRRRAGQALARRSEQGERDLIEYVLGLSLTDAPVALADTSTRETAWRIL